MSLFHPLFALGLSALAGQALAAATLAPPESRIEHKPLSAIISHEFGSILSGQAEAETLTGQWIQRTGAFLSYEAIMDHRLEIKAGLGGIFWYSIPEQPGTFESQNRYFAPTLAAAYGAYRFGDPADPSAVLTLGYFPFKYHRDARNLGEYMFRTGTYPGYVVTGGMIIAKTTAVPLLGARWSAAWPPSVSHDVLLTSSTTLYPFYDFSLSYLAAWKPGKALEVGAGVQLANALPVKPSHTTPKTKVNSYFTENGTDYYAVSNYYRELGDSATAAFVDQRTNEDTSVVPLAGRPRYKHYTFQGVKLMLRASLDFKAFLPAGMLGEEDLRFYAEAAVLGVKDYPVLYDNLAERIPVMAGVTLPAFRLLDVLAVEVERYGSRFLNSYDLPYSKNAPIPFVQADYHQEDPGRDDFKWSVYAERRVVGGFSVVAQAASDHLRSIQWPGITDRKEALIEKRDWYYVVRLILKI